LILFLFFIHWNVIFQMNKIAGKRRNKILLINDLNPKIKIDIEIYQKGNIVQINKCHRL
jgi:hypothetical protein